MEWRCIGGLTLHKMTTRKYRRHHYDRTRSHSVGCTILNKLLSVLNKNVVFCAR